MGKLGLGTGVGLTILLTKLVLAWCLRARDLKTGIRALKYSVRYRVLSTFCFAMGLIAAFGGLRVLFFLEAPSELGRWSVATGLFALGGGGVYMLLESYFVRITYDQQYVYTSSPWRRPRRIAWSDIIYRKYSHTNHWYVFETKGQGKLRLSKYLSGLTQFLEAYAEDE